MILHSKNLSLILLATLLLTSDVHGSAVTFADPIREVFEPAGEFDPKVFAKVAVVQWNPSSAAEIGTSKAKAEAFKMRNRKELTQYIREAAEKGAELVVTPEFGILGYPDIPELPNDEDAYRSREDVAPYVELVPGPSTRFFSTLAKELKIYIQVGFAEVDAKTDLYYNVAVALDPAGRIVGKHRKINLFKLEEAFLGRGEKTVTYSTPFGLIGMAICADIYSSKPMDDLKALRVDAIALSTSWAERNTGMTHFKQAARWAKAAVLASNQHYFPDSGVVSANGIPQSHIRQSVGVAYGYLKRKPTALRPNASRR